MTQTKQNLGIVLGGGGARAAYQVGVIKALAEMLPSNTPLPFPIVCGTSAGAFNAAALASFANNFQRAAASLLRIWGNFHTHHVYRSDVWGVSKTGAQWLAAMMLGGLGKRNPVYLLDRQPLRQIIQKHMPLPNIQRFIDQGYLHALSVSASGYSSGESLAFFQGHPDIQPWHRSRRRGVACEITVDHLMASSAIPLLFEAIKINREYFGDGSMRQIAPVSSALHLGADALLIVGNNRSEDETSHERKKVTRYPSLAEIGGFALDSIFLDSLDADIERLHRINKTVSSIPQKHLDKGDVSLKRVETVVITPSQDLGELAHEHVDDMPRTIRFLMRGIGAHSEEGSSSLMSYLLFEKSYCQELIKLGAEDTRMKKDEILELLGNSLVRGKMGK